MKKCLITSTIAVFFIISCKKDDNGSQTELVPEPANNIMDVLANDSNFTTVSWLIQENGYADELSDPESEVTFFAPTDQAFQNQLDTLPDFSTIEELDSAYASIFLLQYWTIGGRHDIQSLSPGIYQEFYGRENAPGVFSNRDILVEKEDGNVVLNGGNQFGATSTGRVLSADNGNIIEVDAKPSEQHLLATIQDGKKLLETAFYDSLMAYVSGSFKLHMKVLGWGGTVLLPTEAQLAKAFDIYLEGILDNSDLDNLLSPSAKDQLFSKYSVSSMDSLRAYITLEDLHVVAGKDMAMVYAEMENEDYDELLGQLGLETSSLEYLDEDVVVNDRFTTWADVEDYAFSRGEGGEIHLTDAAGNVIVLGSELISCSNGDIYFISEIIEH